MIQIDKTELGAIDNCTPYIASYIGDGTLSNFIKNGSAYWITINSDKVNDNDLYLIFVNYINYNVNLINSLTRSYIPFKFKNLINENKNVAYCTIKGLYVNGFLFVNDRYRSECDINIDIKSDENILINHLNINVQNLNLIGKFDLNKCTYFCRFS